MLLLLACILAGCAAHAPRQAWEDRMRGNAVLLLGEVHDNADQHRQRLDALRRIQEAERPPLPTAAFPALKVIEQIRGCVGVLRAPRKLSEFPIVPADEGRTGPARNDNAVRAIQ
jgi:hypothetical protein